MHISLQSVTDLIQMAEKTTRLNLVIPQRTADRLEQLREKTEATSNVEVVKNALRLYEALIGDVADGKEIMSRDSAGNLTSYKLFA
jgi:hypothetical protein